MFRHLICATFLAAALSGGGGAVAAPVSDDQGQEIMAQHVSADSGWGDASADVTMTLKSPGGGMIAREMSVHMLEKLAGGDLSLSVFQKPADVRGTALLSHAHSLGADDQWLYLPTLKRTKRVSSVNKSGPFLGSEFSFEDLSAFELDKYTYSREKEETIDGVVHDVVVMRPRYEYSGYDRIEVAVERDRLVFRRLVFHDRRGEAFKIQDNSKFTLIGGHYWRPLHMHMRNLRTGKETIVEWSNYTLGNGFRDGDFSAARLSRMSERMR